MATRAEVLRARTAARGASSAALLKAIRASLARLVEDGRIGPDPERLLGRHLGARC